MPSRPTRQLIAWIEQSVPGMEPGARLPSDAELASRWGLSLRTVKTVLHALGERGVVSRVQGRGTFAPRPAAPSPTELPLPQDSCDTIVQHISSAIATGEFRVGDPLPSVKFISISFRVSPRTVVAAYRELASRGLVRKVGRSFWVGGLVESVRRQPQRLVYLFHDARHQPAAMFSGDLLADAYRRMEEELGNHGFVLRCENAAAFAGLFGRWTRRNEWPAGIAFFRMESGVFDDHYRLLAGLPAPAGAYPARVLVDWHQGSLDMRHRWLQVVSRGSILTAYARTLAQYLARRTGPVGIVFSEQRRLWNEYDYLFPMLRLWVEMRHACPDLRRQFFVLGSRTGTDLLAAQWQHPDNLERVKTQLAKYGPAAPEQFSRDVLFVKSLAQARAALRGARMWVCASEQTAADLMDMLGREKKRVPGDVEIVGLENDPSYYHLGITHCGPDWQRLGYLMAHALIGDIPIARTGKGFLRSAARVRERLTTKG